MGNQNSIFPHEICQDEHITLPKKVGTPHCFYVKVKSATKKAELTSATGVNASAPVVLRALAEEWKGLPEAEKAKYQKLVEADKQRYDRQMCELINNGYFTLENGKKSV